MDKGEQVIRLKEYLRLVNSSEDGEKEKGLQLLDTFLGRDENHTLVELGYDQAIMKNLISLIQFESGSVLEKSLDLIERFFFKPENLDEIAETIIYRIARSTDYEVCRQCLFKLSSLVDSFDEGLAKHSKQILKLADLNDMMTLNPLISQILVKMKQKLPERL